MTLQEIAELAGVSSATVSRIVNRVPTVNPGLAKRVWRVIEQEGYYPNTHARTLVRGRSRIFGLMVSDVVIRFFPEMVERFTDLGIKHSYDILLSPIPQDLHRFDIAARRLIENRVDGVAVLTFGQLDSLLEPFRRSNVPVFVVDAEFPGPSLRTICIDYKDGIRQAVQHLAALGHTSIAFISGPENLKTAMARKVAFQQCMNEIGLHSKMILVENHNVDAYRMLRTLLGQDRDRDRPSAAICWNDITAIGVVQAAFDLGINIPKDFSIVGFDDIWPAQFTVPALTTVQISQIEIANDAFAQLLTATETQSNARPRALHKTKTNLVLRSSTALAPDRACETAARVRARTTVASELR